MKIIFYASWLVNKMYGTVALIMEVYYLERDEKAFRTSGVA